MSRILRIADAPPPNALRFWTEDSEIPPKRAGVQMKPIQWGQPDPALAKLVLQNIVDTTPPVVIRWNPLTSPRISRYLHQCGIHF